MNKTITELRCRELLRDEKGLSQCTQQGRLIEIFYHEKNITDSIVFDKHVTSSQIIDILLEGKQYTILLYDKGLIQTEYFVPKVG